MDRILVRLKNLVLKKGLCLGTSIGRKIKLTLNSLLSLTLNCALVISPARGRPIMATAASSSGSVARCVASSWTGLSSSAKKEHLINYSFGIVYFKKGRRLKTDPLGKTKMLIAFAGFNHG